MKADENNKKLDELISKTIGRDKPEFDFDKWKDLHQKEIQVFKSQKTEQQTSRSIRIFKNRKNNHEKQGKQNSRCGGNNYCGVHRNTSI